MSEKPSEVRQVLDHLRGMLEQGALGPGMRLPAERRLAEALGVSRAHVRDAFQTLENYGIVRTFPQSGTVLADHSASVLKNLIENMMEIDSFDFYSLVHVRVLLEVDAIRLCAESRTERDIATLRAALEDFRRHMHGDGRDEKDFAFHLAVAQASHNPVVASLLLEIAPDVLRYYRKYHACTVDVEEVFREHEGMLRHIIDKDPDAAEACIRDHFKVIENFAARYRGGEIPRTRI